MMSSLHLRNAKKECQNCSIRLVVLIMSYVISQLFLCTLDYFTVHLLLFAHNALSDACEVMSVCVRVTTETNEQISAEFHVEGLHQIPWMNLI